MYGRKASTKEERAQMRAEALEGYTVTEYPEADSVAGKMTAGNRTVIKIFDGTAGKPYCFYSFKTEAAADAYIAEHMKRRAANKAFDAEQKAKQEANRRNADPELPRFEIGRSYYDKHYCDDGYDSEYITEIEIKDRSACFVTYCEKNRRGDGEPKRAKIKFDDKGEYISDGWNYYRAAAIMPTEEEQAAQREAERKAREEKEQQDRENARVYFEQLTEEARQIIDNAEEPKAGAPYVIIEWSESPVINRLNIEAEDSSRRKLSIKAADELFKLLDSRQNSDREKFDFLGWYDKTSFIIHFTNDAGEPDTYEGRQDFGDGDGGIIEHIKAFAASYRSYGEKKPGDPTDEEIRADLAKFAQKLESYARPVYVLDSTRTAEHMKQIKEAQAAQTARELNELNTMLLMLGNDDIEQLARNAPDRTTKQFLYESFTGGTIGAGSTLRGNFWRAEQPAKRKNRTGGEKMKLHKIRNIDINICSAEQKIAYNFAFAGYSWADLEQVLENLARYREQYRGKYDSDAIAEALRNGYEAYKSGAAHIFTSYEEIGKAFPLGSAA